MNPNDRDALGLALTRQRAHSDPGRRWQIEEMLKEDPWAEAAHFASYSQQRDALHLKPWEEPPCDGDKNGPDTDEANHLLKQMLALGISRYHPSPIEAIAEAKKAADHA